METQKIKDLTSIESVAETDYIPVLTDEEDNILEKIQVGDLLDGLLDDVYNKSETDALINGVKTELETELASKVNTDGTNLTEDFANALLTNFGGKFTNAMMPDYSAGVSKSANTTYTAEVDGWIIPKTTVTVMWAGVFNGTTYLNIDDTEVWKNQVTGHVGEWGGSFAHTSIIPIVKGQTYKLTVTGNANGTMIFYPCIGS